MQKKIDELRQKRASLYLGGGEKRIARQHEKGKLTARERLGSIVRRRYFSGSKSVYGVCHWRRIKRSW
jgi:acetyl-CoA carboxylase carboxyltransferase component